MRLILITLLLLAPLNGWSKDIIKGQSQIEAKRDLCHALSEYYAMNRQFTQKLNGTTASMPVEAAGYLKESNLKLTKARHLQQQYTDNFGDSFNALMTPAACDVKLL